jgi:Membrane bound beta barrel domain (DUF5777)
MSFCDSFACKRHRIVFLTLSILAATLYSYSQEPSGNAVLKDVVGTPTTGVPNASSTPGTESKIKVVFDDTTPGVVIIESNGEKIRVDTRAKRIEQLTAPANVDTSSPAGTTQTTAKAPQTTQQKDESAYDFDRGEEPYDYRVVNVPTPKSVPKHSWNLVFTHRFTQPVRPVKASASNLLGLDSFGIASFGLTYGITDKLHVSAYRSPLCQRGMCKTIELGIGYTWLAHDKDSPIALETYASVEGNNNFREEHTYNLQVKLSARAGKRVYLFFSPAVHLNSNGQRRFDPRPSDYFPPAIVADSFHLPTNGASFGFGASVLVTPNVVALFDFVPRTGFKLGNLKPIRDTIFGPVTGFTNESHPSLGFGIQRNIGKHAFTLTFSNTQATTTSRYNSSNLFLTPGHFVIGFNLSRRF